MSSDIPQSHPIRAFFTAVIHDAAAKEFGPTADELMERYLTDLLVRFLHRDSVFSIRDPLGTRLTTIGDMLLEGDVTLNANSFERERQVHRHIGDTILFWSGVYPEFLRRLKSAHESEATIDYLAQAEDSYAIVSSFDHPPFEHESVFFARLSRNVVPAIHVLQAARGMLGPNP
ncbi:MAG: hypothetical protein ACK4XJ_10455 [Fimbriimonadaceae bacterium]